jgi:ABC-2 type transport system ATP-binding protein
LILDEPTVGLDPEHRDLMWALIERERRERGATVLFSTHYLAEAESCDRVVLLANGRVVADAAPDALKRSVGSEIVELEGAGAERLVLLLSSATRVRFVSRTRRGVRLGISSPHDELARIVGSAPDVTHFAIRPATLEDVYFARTQEPQQAADRVPASRAL